MRIDYQITISFLILILVSCHTDKDRQPEPFLETNDKFVENTLRFSVNEQNLKANLTDSVVIYYQAVTNNHNPKNIDTIMRLITVNSLRDEFEIYKTVDKEIFFSATIRSNHISLKNDIQVGMSKEQFCTVMNLETVSNGIKISNIAQTFNWVFYFSKSKLDSIVYDGYID
ncbi:MAG: hypothetical protein HOD63_02265 [Bacteroidetes bacterium]|jgi:hypothetical protein|nr:hypothetical protein [Bacteroidota bacterium]MBT5530023.1 hypothetical protein [Cytophagia bacterium]MBT3424497.1 hypothetical protein [Bacteroidota bacterium]MBT3802902.1 hypothetical protein [Bacteroidota bacterium]MBT3933238.1 hypothetical protein [Bacteroidota bacterium]